MSTPRPEVQEENREDTDVLGREDAVGESVQGESRGHQYATCDDTGGWQMHEPSHPWTEGTVFQQSTPHLSTIYRAGQASRQQSTRPRQPNNQAWTHNGIREGTPGCLYINAYNNQDSLE